MYVYETNPVAGGASARGTGLGRALLSDVDECSLPETPCLRKHENCYNTPGSYVCVCPEGFEETEDACVQAPQPAGEGEWGGLQA